jgi:putative spermidine/putrescine transport system substrate-binding protein
MRNPQRSLRPLSFRSSWRPLLDALAGAGALCGPLLAQAEATLYVANVGGSNEQMYRQTIIPAFEKAHNVKIVYVAGNSSDTLAKLQAQKGHEQINVAVMDDGPMYQAIQMGLCSKVADAPVMNDLYPLARLGPTAIGVGMVATGIGYNEEAFKKMGLPAPDSWNVLSDTRLKGKLGVPPITNTYGLHALVMPARMNGGGEKNIDPGFNAMTKQVAPNVLSWAPTPGEMDGLMQNGDVILAPYGSGRAVALQNTGFPLKFFHPMIRTGVVGGWVLSFIQSFDELTMTIFVATPGTTTLPVAMYNQIAQTIDPLVASVSTVLIVGTVVLMLVLDRMVGLDRVLIGETR